jgi:arylsulfatase A-like enzyme
MNRLLALFLATSGSFLLTSCKQVALEKPNILWLTSEDNSPYLGCYGDELARTPNLDRLAVEGVRYRNAFANAPVCSSARSTLITGMYASSLGIHNHRSGVSIPDSFRFYPELLREAGYYCTNNSKTDYNFLIDGKRNSTHFWDESSTTAHYRNRAPDQPFFAVFNTTISHEGQTTDQAYSGRKEKGLLPPERVVPPSKVTLPPYHPDTEIIRENWSRYYDNLWLMDKEVGRLLDELDAEGLAKDTIVFYYADHGGALPRGKRNIHDSGTRVPLIIRFPEKWSHLAPAEPGEWVDGIVSFVDLPATLFSLIGIPMPSNYEGTPFLGEQSRSQDHVLLFRGRMDERYDTVRAVRTPEYLYVNNFSPHRPLGQHYSYPFRVMPSMQSWYDECLAGGCNPVQARYWQEKSGEEFYIVASDPFQINNRIGDSEYSKVIEELRSTLRDDLVRTRDIGFIPEGMFSWLPGEKNLYEYAQGDSYPIERIVEVASMASSRDPWAATGCLILKDGAAPAKEKLLTLLDDPAADVRTVAAETLGHLGEVPRAVDSLSKIVQSGNEHEILAAMTVLEIFTRLDLIPATQARELTARDHTDIQQRVYDWIGTLVRGS